MEQAREADRIKKEHEDGLNFILTQQEIADNVDAQQEVAEILRRPDMAYIAQKFPAKAAKLAVDEYKASLGIGNQGSSSTSCCCYSYPENHARPDH